MKKINLTEVCFGLGLIIDRAEANLQNSFQNFIGKQDNSNRTELTADFKIWKNLMGCSILRGCTGNDIFDITDFWVELMDELEGNINKGAIGGIANNLQWLDRMMETYRVDVNNICNNSNIKKLL